MNLIRCDFVSVCARSFPFFGGSNERKSVIGLQIQFYTKFDLISSVQMCGRAFFFIVWAFFCVMCTSIRFIGLRSRFILSLSLSPTLSSISSLSFVHRLHLLLSSCVHAHLDWIQGCVCVHACDDWCAPDVIVFSFVQFLFFSSVLQLHSFPFYAAFTMLECGFSTMYLYVCVLCVFVEALLPPKKHSSVVSYSTRRTLIWNWARGENRNNCNVWWRFLNIILCIYGWISERKAVKMGKKP